MKNIDELEYLKELEDLKVLLKQKDDLIHNLSFLIDVYEKKVADFGIKISKLQSDLNGYKYLEDLDLYEQGRHDTIVEYENVDITDIFNCISSKFQDNKELVDFINHLKSERLNKLDSEYFLN